MGGRHAELVHPVNRYAAALRETLHALIELGTELSDADWHRPTECPLWTVGDVYGHVTAGEQWMASGHPPPAGFQEWIDADVHRRRGQSRAEVLHELTEVARLRGRQLADPPDPAGPATYPWGEPTTVADLLGTRVFDCWVHEQDVRRAVGRPGGLDAPGGYVARDILVPLLPRIVARRAKAPAGATVRLTVTDQIGMDLVVAVDDSGRGRLAPTVAGHPTAHITLAWESYARLSAGRGQRAEHHAVVTGDRELAERVLAHLAITP